MESVKKPQEDKVKIANEVIANIAGIAAVEINGVSSMSGGITDGIASMLGKKNLAKGVKVDATENDVTIEVSIFVDYGCKIHEIAKAVQEKVRSTVEAMTGMNVVAIIVNVLGINIDKTLKESD